MRRLAAKAHVKVHGDGNDRRAAVGRDHHAQAVRQGEPFDLVGGRRGAPSGARGAGSAGGRGCDPLGWYAACCRRHSHNLDTHPINRAAGRCGESPRRVAHRVPLSNRDHCIRAGRWRQPRRRPGWHAQRAAASGDPSRPGLRLLDRRAERRRPGGAAHDGRSRPAGSGLAAAFSSRGVPAGCPAAAGDDDAFTPDAAHGRGAGDRAAQCGLPVPPAGGLGRGGWARRCAGPAARPRAHDLRPGPAHSARPGVAPAGDRGRRDHDRPAGAAVGRQRGAGVARSHCPGRAVPSRARGAVDAGGREPRRKYGGRSGHRQAVRTRCTCSPADSPATSTTPRRAPSA